MLGLFPASFIDDLKSHADIVQVVQERVPLRRSGATWKGLCPFHGEKTPSFNVNGDKGYFKCFGCGVGGDVIKFVELYDKVAFPEAVRQLAARAGLTVPEAEDSKEDAETQRDREGAAEGARSRRGVVPRAARDAGGAAARRLLEERGVTPRSIERSGIGYAPAVARGL